MFTLIINLIIFIISIVGIIRPQIFISKSMTADYDETKMKSVVTRTRLACVGMLILSIIMTIRVV